MDKLANAKRLLKEQLAKRDKNTALFTTKLKALMNSYLPKVLALKGVDQDEAASVIGGLMDGLKQAGLNDLYKEFRSSYAEELETLNAQLSVSLASKQILSTVDSDIIETMIDYNNSKTTRLIAPYIDDIGSTVLRYAVIGESPDIDSILAKSVGLIESQVRTEVDTLLSEFSRTITAKKASEFGIELFEYYGADDKLTRPFCEDLLNGSLSGFERSVPIYSLEEIRSMDNGQGLDVLTNCGGYNCRHHWQPVSEERAKELGYGD